MAVEGDSVVNIGAAIGGPLVFVLVAAIVIQKMFGKTLSTTDKLIFGWVALGATAHLLVDAPYVCSHFLHGPAALVKSGGFYAKLYEHFAKSDKRLLSADPYLMGIMLMIVAVLLPLEVLLCCSIAKNKSNRHFLQVVTAVIYSSLFWMYAVPELFKGDKSDVDFGGSLKDIIFTIVFGTVYVSAVVLMLSQSCCAMGSTGKITPKAQKTEPQEPQQAVRRSSRLKKKAE
ncbi:emopamil-binding protein-like [Glandiceps talaboti]